MPAGASLKLTVAYVPPSLNKTKRQHWREQYREKRKAWAALSSALRASASNSSTTTILKQVSKTCSMALDMHILFGTTLHGKSGWKSNNNKLDGATNEQRSS